ncbi:MAG: hypothetical protein J0M30_01885 [Chitinophagales bacterium]|nr:hypothetical protein [Chitinophagales bacterium]
MEENKPQEELSGLEKTLHLDFRNENEQIWLTNQNSLRILIGVLGILLPLLLPLVIWIDIGYWKPLYSISHYYFTRSSPVFIIIVSLMAIFLLVYKGKKPIDFILSSLAGVFALILVVFPTDSISFVCRDPDHLYSLAIYPDNSFRAVVHYVGAAIFLGSLAAMSLFLFTKSDKPPHLRGVQKRRRNRVFRTCGVIMVLALLVILANPLKIISNEDFEKYHLMFWMETVAVWAFGTSWLVKAEVILKDKPKA